MCVFLCYGEIAPVAIGYDDLKRASVGDLVIACEIELPVAGAGCACAGMAVIYRIFPEFAVNVDIRADYGIACRYGYIESGENCVGLDASLFCALAAANACRTLKRVEAFGQE